MKEIYLRNTKNIALIDDEDYQKVMTHSEIWTDGMTTAYRGRKTVVCHSSITGKTESLHRVIMDAASRSDMYVDHIDRNYLNNCKSNLRFVTPQQNMFNKRSSGRGVYSTPYKGITWEPSRKKWKATINVSGRSYNLGRFLSEKEAAIAYNNAAIKFHGEFAVLNVI
jgi:hypothetical protein